MTDIYLSANELTGEIPDISGLTALGVFRVSGNQLSGTPPDAPVNLADGGSWLCPNLLHETQDLDWDAATGQTPWSIGCTPGWLVSTSAGSGGSIAPQRGVVDGQTTDIVITPDAGFEIDAIAGGASSCGGARNGTTFTIAAITDDCSVEVTFKQTAEAVAPIPTLGQCALLLLGMVLAGLGAGRLRRH